MKTLILLLAISTQAMAQDVLLLTCTKTTFRDLEKITITQSDDQILVTETNELGLLTTSTQTMEAWNTKEINLSDWYGYKRILNYSYGQWMIDHHDECSGGSSYVICQ